MAKQLTRELIAQNPEYSDLLRLEDEPYKLIATIGKENVFVEVSDLDQGSVFNYYSGKGIFFYSTPPWVVDGQYEGLTIFWKQDALQQKLDENEGFLKDHLYPTNARSFAMRVCHVTVNHEKDPELYKFVADCFADFDNPNLTN